MLCIERIRALREDNDYKQVLDINYISGVSDIKNKFPQKYSLI